MDDDWVVLRKTTQARIGLGRSRNSLPTQRVAELSALPLIATQARVGISDHIGQALGVATVLVLVGERPGLSVADSLGIYLTQLPAPGRTDADRNYISNIHPPDGLDYHTAAVTAAAPYRQPGS